MNERFLASRLLLEADLQPIQGERFQPTGFPDLMAAEYVEPRQGGRLLLVESPQSMANRLEAVCWDEAADDLAPALQGLPYVRVHLAGTDGEVFGATTSILEAHRLNSPYIMAANDHAFRELLRERLGLRDKKSGGPLDRRRLAQVVFQYDPGALLHGVFLEKLDGRARLQRVLSAFIEARGVERAVSGGVKIDRVDASGSTAEGYGNVPYVRTEYTAQVITAYFNIDLAQIRAYGLGETAQDLLVNLALWKIRRFLDSGLRLRTACDLVLADNGTRAQPADFALPELAALEQRLGDLIATCRSDFADPLITELTWQETKAKKGKGKEDTGGTEEAK